MPEFYEIDQEQLELEDFCDADAAAKILVVGVGGGGGNAVNHMIEKGIEGVDFLAVNTDAQALRSNRASGRMLLYSESLGKKKGLGAGGKPDRAREAAEASLDRLRARLAGYDMVFITAGMGGGTGTGAASVIAQLAKEMEILTVGVVTKPSEGEGGERLANAEQGIKALAPHVDALLVILNDKLKECLAIPRPTLLQCFGAANDVLKNAVAGIVEIITRPGLINVDFNDVKTVLESTGRALMGMATVPAGDIVALDGQGGRASIAVQQAIKSPLLEGVDFSTAKAVLLNITAPSDFQMDEVDEALATIKSFTVEGANVIHGVIIDDDMGDRLRVTIIATGLDSPPVVRAQPSLSLISQATGTDDAVARQYSPSEESAIPAIFRRQRNPGNAQVGRESAPAQTFAPLAPRRPAMIGSGREGILRRDGVSGGNRAVPDRDPPAFLKKQAD
ncbi:MAG: cell division protein FtsZ [Zoogloeaceae bacterium]|jgi:cell division protein FtsZ|nr:cell division protein FtsZ [Zoogloeaceae bacterium]